MKSVALTLNCYLVYSTVTCKQNCWCTIQESQ